MDAARAPQPVVVAAGDLDRRGRSRPAGGRTMASHDARRGRKHSRGVRDVSRDHTTETAGVHACVARRRRHDAGDGADRRVSPGRHQHSAPADADRVRVAGEPGWSPDRMVQLHRQSGEPVRGEARMSEIGGMRQQARLTRDVVRMNLEGISHEQSLIQPKPAGNCSNWVVGHLVTVYNRVLPLLGQTPVDSAGDLARYARGSSALTRASDAVPLRELVSAWDEACVRVDTGLAALPPRQLEMVVPDGPTGDPNETMRSLLAVVLFHQAYHAGQLGILRRIAGEGGAIA